ncbi:hypothetical protein BU25DRAFT_161692 [Macroventuria anomochaeta]|uniref:Uncharacterized protein n=1 Tax=Macroventuria anomochaeta TaxID=301207 RepID=A0ACB6RT77_9PLEO|nr:uncharacterized protein BU25DRAFT_161692 [Macroventuria anomochaeta]KAF2624112.1 hypothetical protein BU25DRAFT_161692 [Macroventuria anomochaeta]
MTHILQSILLEEVNDPWKTAESLFSERLLEASNFDDLKCFVNPTGQYLESLGKELAVRDTKNVVVDFATIMGTLTGQLTYRLKTRREVLHLYAGADDEVSRNSEHKAAESESSQLTDPKDESKSEDISGRTRQLQEFTSKMTLCDETGNDRQQSLHHDDLRDYYELVGKEAAELEAEIAAGNINSVYTFHSNMTVETINFPSPYMQCGHGPGFPLKENQAWLYRNCPTSMKYPKKYSGCATPRSSTSPAPKKTTAHQVEGHG